MFDIQTTAELLKGEDAGAVIEILDAFDEPAMFGGTETVGPDGEKIITGATPVSITAVGMNSKQYRKVEAWQRKELRKLGGRAQTGEEQLLMQSEFVARCCLGWNGFTNNGEPFPFSTENAVSLFTKLPFVQRQVERAMGQSSRFLGKSTTP